MCGVMEGLAIAGAVTSFVGGQSQASATSDAAKANLEAQYAQTAEKQKQINEQSALETNERQRQGMIDRAESMAIAGESGALGFSSDRLMADSFMQEGTDLMSIEQNRSNQMKQTDLNNQSSKATAQSQANAAYSKAPGLIGTGLQIGGTIAKYNQTVDTATTDYVGSHLRSQDNIMDKAFDAFTQRRDTGTKDRVTERRRVDTYSDPNRYQMPPRRRLGVYAQNKSVFVDPAKSNITAFAEGLAEVQPQIMEYLAHEEIEANKKEVQLGVKDAMASEAMKAGDTEFIDSEWRQFAFEQKKAMMAGEELTTQLLIDVENKDPMVDFQPWYEDWYAQKMEQFPHLATMDPEVMESYNKPLHKGITKARNFSLVTKEQTQQDMYQATATDYITKTLEEAIELGHEIDNDLVERIIADEENMSRWGMTKNNEILFDAVGRIAKGDVGKRNIDALKYLHMGRGEGGTLPSVAEMKHDEVTKLKKEVQDLIDADERKVNALADQVEEDIKAKNTEAKSYFKRIIGAPEDIVDIPGATRTRAKVAEWQGQAMEDYRDLVDAMTDQGMPLDLAHDEALKKLEADYKISGKLAPAYTEAQEADKERVKNSLTYTHSLIKQPNYNQIAADVYQGIDTQGGFDPSTVIPGWDQMLPEHRTTVIKRGRQEYAARIRVEQEKEAVAAAELAKSNADTAKTTVREDTKANAEALKKVTDASGKVIAQSEEAIAKAEDKDTEERVKEQNSGMHLTLKIQEEKLRRKNEAETIKREEEIAAWHRDVDLKGKLEDEFDTPFELVPNMVQTPDGPVQDGWKQNPSKARKVDNDFKRSVDDNVGLYQHEGFEPHDPGTFGESIYGQIWDGIVDVGERLYDIYDTYDGPAPIEINPMQEEYSATDRDENGRFQIITNDRVAPTPKVIPEVEKVPGVVQNKQYQSISTYLKDDKDMRPEAIAAILGNIDVETGGTYDSKQLQKNGPGYGLFQLEGSKAKAYKKFIKTKALEDSPQSQLEFMYETIYGDLQSEIGKRNANTLRVLFMTGTVEEITEGFERLWERPSKPHSSRRQKSAKEHLAKIT